MLFLFSAVLYFFNFLLYGDAHHLVQTFTEELAFMPVYVLITAVFAERMLTKSEKAEMSRKTNALVGTFYNEIGYDMVVMLTKFDGNFETLRSRISIDSGWDSAKAKAAHKLAETHRYGAPEGIEDIRKIGELLSSRKDFMLIMMSNASLLEKDEFSELLLSVNHIHEALKAIDDISGMRTELVDHFHGDIEKAYRCLLGVLVSYLSFIKNEDPYLYMLAVEKNPFRRAAGISDKQ
jgi:branched-subunit amino acid transport protein